MSIIRKDHITPHHLLLTNIFKWAVWHGTAHRQTLNRRLFIHFSLKAFLFSFNTPLLLLLLLVWPASKQPKDVVTCRIPHLHYLRTAWKDAESAVLWASGPPPFLSLSLSTLLLLHISPISLSTVFFFFFFIYLFIKKMNWHCCCLLSTRRRAIKVQSLFFKEWRGRGQASPISWLNISKKGYHHQHQNENQ